MNRFLLPVMLLLGAAPAFAQPDPAATQQAKQEMVDAKLDAFGARLGLDANELGRFRGTLDRFHSQLKPLRQDAMATRRTLRDEMAKAQPDDGKLAQLTDRLASDRQQIQSLQAQKMAELRHELTPQQYAKLMLARARFGRHMHGGGRERGK
jgi:Spy/CpxP family protein refolding chaperone